MDRNLTVRMVTILVILGICLYLLYPTYQYFTRYRNLTEEQVAELSETERRNAREVLQKSMKLGLDLQGGMHLVLEIDEASLGGGDRRDAQDRVMEILSTRVDQFGVTEPTITRQGTNRILMQLPGVEDPERAKGLVGDVAQLEFRMVREQVEIVNVVQAINDLLVGKEADADTTAAAADTSVAPPMAAADTSSASPADTSAVAAADTSILPELPDLPGSELEVADSNQFGGLFVDLNFGALYAPDDGYRVERVEEFLQREDVRAAINRTVPRSEFLWSSEDGPLTPDGVPTKLLYLVSTQVDLKGDRLQDARAEPDPDRPGGLQVRFRLDRRGARKFSQLTADNVGKQLSIVLDGVVKSAPSIRGRIPGGEGSISGSFTDAQARDLAIVLRAGALPVQLSIVEERTVGPTLGSDSLSRGLTAALVGLGVTILFLLIYYQFAGLLASLAVIMNLVIVLAAMATLRAALSLPGIAGLVLAVAMAVDANVLIFERIREELRKAKTVTASVDAGYKNALSAIIDSNLTTLFAGIVLLYAGTGPIKGFAVTLCIGIIASMFTALFVTRFAFDAITHRRRLKKLAIGSFRLVGDTAIDFIGKRRSSFVLSTIVILVGLGSIAVRGGIRLGVDFTGGVQVEVAIEENVGEVVDIGRVRDAVAAAGYDNRNIQQVGGAEQNHFLIHLQTVEERSLSPDEAEAQEGESSTIATTTSERILQSLRDEFAGAVTLRSVESVGPKVGNELRNAAIEGVLAAMLLVVLYVAWRFEFRYGVATLAAVAHDVLVTLGLFSLFNKEMTLSIVAALLTLVGYSVNDTIVIFDRIREELKQKQRRESFESIFNAGINKTLTRTILTSFTTLFVLVSLLVYGGEVIHDFAWVLMIGVIVGTYSSIFVAAPLVIVWQKRRAEREARRAA
ncbi:MAG: protein translocase subunit SecD [Candidatus Latescibacterota bacterium]|nr:MAG: protein translocase subunit SecD [Candidatus Latescibacterota bacterium]